MKTYRIYPDTIVIDLRTHGPGGSAINQFVSCPGVVVYSGDLGDSVMWKVGDVSFRIVMDHDPKGNWKDGEWARERAWSSMLREMGPDDLEQLLSAQFLAGVDKGRKDAKGEMRRTLGLDDE